MKSDNEAFSSPLLCPPYNRPPYPVEDAKLVIVRFKADPAAIAKLVPRPLEVVGDGIVTAFIVGSSRVDLQACKLEYSIVSPK